MQNNFALYIFHIAFLVSVFQIVEALYNDVWDTS